MNNVIKSSSIKYKFLLGCRWLFGELHQNLFHFHSSNWPLLYALTIARSHKPQP